jgi:hypothetical protein
MSFQSDRIGFSSRLSQVRCEVFGEDGIPQLAQNLGIPPRTWVNFESGVIVPDMILLGFLCLTGVSPRWLLTGEGELYSTLARPTIQFG